MSDGEGGEGGHVDEDGAERDAGDTGSDEECVYEGGEEIEGQVRASGYEDMPKSFDDITPFLEMCTKKWRGAWSAGTYIVPDESMIYWVGSGAPHLTFIPRKPTPLGIMMKTACCGSSGVMLNAEITEAKEVMDNKPFAKEWGATTGTTLRLVAPYFGKKKVVIADSWFASVRTAFALKK